MSVRLYVSVALYNFFQSTEATVGMFFKIAVVKNFAIFTGKQLCWRLLQQSCRPKILQFLKRDSNAGVFL